MLTRLTPFRLIVWYAVRGVSDHELQAELISYFANQLHAALLSAKSVEWNSLRVVFSQKIHLMVIVFTDANMFATSMAQHNVMF